MSYEYTYKNKQYTNELFIDFNIDGSLHIESIHYYEPYNKHISVAVLPVEEVDKLKEYLNHGVKI